MKAKIDSGKYTKQENGVQTRSSFKRIITYQTLVLSSMLKVSKFDKGKNWR